MSDASERHRYNSSRRVSGAVIKRSTVGVVVRLWRFLRLCAAALLRLWKGSPVTVPVTWRARLRFRLQKKLRIESNEHRLEVAGREVVVSPPTPDMKIADSEWLIMNARGFASEDEARQFGNRLKTALDLSAIAARIGVDTGRSPRHLGSRKDRKGRARERGRARARQHSRA